MSEIAYLPFPAHRNEEMVGAEVSEEVSLEQNLSKRKSIFEIASSVWRPHRNDKVGVFRNK